MPDGSKGFSPGSANEGPEPNQGEKKMQIPRPKLNYANVIATIALFVALGGAAVAAGLPKKSVGAKQLKPGAVTTKALHHKAVTAGKIAPKAVTAGKLGPFAVLPGNLGNGIISSEKIGDGAVIAAKIRNGAVTTNKLDSSAVATGKLGDGAVTSAKLDNGAVNSSKLAEGSVGLTKLGKGVVGQLQTSQLESGQTLRGEFAVGGGGTKTESGDTAYGSITYQFPLQKQTTSTVMQMDETSATCPGRGGDNQTPQAAPGHTCIYIMGWQNIEPSADPLHTLNDTKEGVGLALEARDAGMAFAAYGTWAVTAP
jgi:hypothetical protein